MPPLARHRAAAIASALLVTAAARASPFTYLALGDSLAWGYQALERTAPGPGDQGYVAGVADGLAAANGGLRPAVLNLGVPGDTSANFFLGGEFGAILNTNFQPVLPTAAQNTLLQEALARNPALPGGPIGLVTLQLGVNDLIDLVFDVPNFLDMPVDTQLALAREELVRVGGNLAVVLATLRSALPAADVRVIGYYDPFAVFLDRPDLDPFRDADQRGVKLARLSAPLLPELNDLLRLLAADADATFVETADLFAGRETELTHITTIDSSLPNIHPNDAGYALIAQRILAVPAPTTLPILTLAAFAPTRRRRAA